MILVAALGVAAVAAAAVAIKKHGSLAAAEASLKKEVANLEAFAGKVDAAAKADFEAVVARIKAIL